MNSPHPTVLRAILFAWVFALAFALAAPPLHAQHCDQCANKGFKDCRDCAKNATLLGELAKTEIRHTHYMKCEKCAGTGQMDCDECTWFETNGAEWKAWKRSADGHRQWMADVKKEIDTQMERPCMVAESKFFRMVWDIEKLKVEKRNLDQPTLLTLYIQRMEALRADYLSVFGIDSGLIAPKTLVMVWANPLDQRRAGAIFVEITSDNGCKFYGPRPVYTVLFGRQNLRTDETLHRNLVHNVSQLLLSSQKPSEWLGQIKGGWVDEGVAHWFEHRYWQICDNYCYVEVDTMEQFKHGHWRPDVRELVFKQTKLIPMVGVISKNTAQLAAQEHAQAWSYCDFLITRDPKRFVEMVRRLMRKESAQQALQAAYGLSLFQFEDEWKKWVLETYPVR